MKTYPQQWTQKDFVYFLHIPKTAGTSVANLLTGMFPQERVLTHYQINNVRKHEPSLFMNARFFYGHFTHDVYATRLPRKPNVVLTFLRDPVQHYISTFFHLKIDPTFTYTSRLTDRKALATEIHDFVSKCSIEEFLESEYSRLYDNFQTRYLVRGLSSSYLDCSDVQLLPVAQKMLLELPCFGLTERFEDSLELIRDYMHYQRPVAPIKHNQARNKPKSFSLSDTALAAIERRTAMDRQLYALASLAFDSRYQAFVQRRSDEQVAPPAANLASG
ncbi:sulfotransferase family 2 domain-containing protein [Kineobactrum salinum]|uniref:Sulfotransferase family protein n=1 Tax=Kineobactrum salinum TaxID=2708301 RepID=A0A6C0U310_9GAMM|nr:sulfotransferase family 2 domain-containing protein [Kineobactrum salinum]QIB66328.1 sulfotransferase family protein [Kineobactrum salinum]